MTCFLGTCHLGLGSGPGSLNAVPPAALGCPKATCPSVGEQWQEAGLEPLSHLKGYRQKDYFIATQGPLAHTVEDFWRMVWEWKCHTIVMLTEVQEREQVSPPPAPAPAASRATHTHQVQPTQRTACPLGTPHLPSAVRPGHDY